MNYQVIGADPGIARQRSLALKRRLGPRGQRSREGTLTKGLEETRLLLRRRHQGGRRPELRTLARPAPDRADDPRSILDCASSGRTYRPERTISQHNHVEVIVVSRDLRVGFRDDADDDATALSPERRGRMGARTGDSELYDDANDRDGD
jgi:hypothetical protein